MASFNQQFLYSVLIIALGYALKRFNILKAKDGEGLSRIVFNLTLPALIVVTFSDFVIDPSLLLLIASCFLFGLLVAAIGLFVFRNEPRKIKGMVCMMVPGFNIGLFAYPLVEGIWGEKGIKYFGMFDVGNSFLVFGLIYLIGSYYSSDDVKLTAKDISFKMLKSIPFMTYIVVFILSIIGIHLPAFIVDTSKIISVANMPMSLLLLGLYLNFRFDKSYNKLLYKFLGIRYLIGLGLGILLFFILPFDNMFKYTLLMGLILPTSVAVLPYSVEFDYNQKFVGIASNVTILLSFFLLWGMTNIIM
ncbi:putative permease [Pullulanibacillus pueri]|uniref:Malonate transporter n=1 Tax=Pullulanibacillus pueri TaxID=1437324 RepID=A0A8J2ZXN9_9BACL|nr:AEC family transporter [Pullulanibacillus pueri]MBM7683592.1 putative permease [Pullulanibacillus pueri]GGH84533.1 malonate transporter [Pullulanibacillus pueri]